MASRFVSSKSALNRTCLPERRGEQFPAMPPAARHLSPPRSDSTSTIVAGTAAGSHLLKIDGYSLTKGTPNGSFLISSQFTVGGHCWRIRYYPNGFSASSADFISLFLVLDEKVKVQAKSDFQISYTGQVDEPPWLATMKADTFDGAGFRSFGYEKFVRRCDFEKLIRDDSFTIRCDIVVINEIRAEESTEITTTTAIVTVPPSDGLT